MSRPEFFEFDRFEPLTEHPLSLQARLEKEVWIVRSEKAILGYFGPFNSPEEAKGACTALRRDPSSKLEKVRVKDL
jgi:hypothetical protein